MQEKIIKSEIKIDKKKLSDDNFSILSINTLKVNSMETKKDKTCKKKS